MPGRSEWLVDHLPMVLRADPFLCRFLGIFQEVTDGVQVHAHALVDIVDVSVAPPEMVRWIGSWVGVDSVDPSIEEARQRRLVRGIGRLLPWRGTAYGLQSLLELVTGSAVHVADTGRVAAAGEPVHEHRFVWVDIEDAKGSSHDYLAALIAAELPPNVGFALRIGGRLVLTDDRDGSVIPPEDPGAPPAAQQPRPPRRQSRSLHPPVARQR